MEHQELWDAIYALAERVKKLEKQPEPSKGATEHATPRTQAQLMQEWGPERFVIALAALADWCRQLAHGDPYSIEEILALQEANDDAFQMLTTTTLYPTP